MDSPSKINHIRSDVSRQPPPQRFYHLGQQYVATVVDGPNNTNAAANVLIRIGNQTMQVRSTMDLRMGDVLKLQVMRVQPQILLSVVAINGVKPSQSTDPLRSALLQLQPHQGGLPQLLGIVKTLAADHPSGNLPVQLPMYLRQLLSAFVARHEITETGALGQAFLNSGLFLESKLLKGDRGKLNDTDFKASLLGLLRLLSGQEDTLSKPSRRDSSDTPPPPHRDAQPAPQPRVQPKDLGSYNDKQIQALLRELTEAALNRLSLHQIVSAEYAREGKLRWLTEIPLYDGEHADVLHLCIARDEYGLGGEERQESWSAELALELPALGPLRVRISLYKGQISTTLWAENAATVEKLNSGLPRLKDALEARKLKIRSLACYVGKPVNCEQADQLPPLLDVKA